MKTKKWISAALAGLMLFVCVGCKNSSDDGNGGNGGGSGGHGGSSSTLTPTNPVSDSTAHYIEGTLHKTRYDYENGKSFVKDGNTNYKIVVSGDSAVAKAAAYISNHVNAATGAELATLSLSDKLVSAYSTDESYIVIGCDELFEKAELTMPTDDIGETGYYIKTVGNSAFIQAYGAEGYQLGALAFLRAVIGYDMLGTDVFSYGRDGSVLPDMELIERPDFDFRVGTDAGNRYGFGFTDNNIFIFVKGTQYHNTFYFLPPETYMAAHKNWYSDRAQADKVTSQLPAYGQLCYTAHGNEDDWNEMVDTLYANVKPFIDANPNLSNITITQQDSTVACLCKTCTDTAAHYGGSNAAAVIKVMNAVDDRLQADLEAEALEKGTKKREFYITFFAYRGYVDAPVTKNSDGTYTAIDGIKCNDHVGVLLAPITASYTHSFYEEVNESHANNITAWATVSNRLYMWLYETNFNHYFFPIATWYRSAETMRFCKENGAIHCYSQSQWDNPTRTAFSFLKDYINSKVEFDVNVNVGDVIDKYFAEYFLDAAEPMREYFDGLQMWFDHLVETYPASISGGYKDNMQNATYWPKRLLDSWLDLINKSYAKIEKYRTTNPALYNALKDRIAVESIFPRYALITFYGGYMNDLLEQKLSFKEDVLALGFTHMDEGRDGLLENLWLAWGV